jgi:hypothetical protein
LYTVSSVNDGDKTLDGLSWPIKNTILHQNRGCAIAQLVSQRLPTTAVQVRSQVGSCGYFRQSEIRAGFLHALWSVLPVLFQLLHSHHHISFRASVIDQTVANIPSKLSLATSQEKNGGNICSN